MQDRQSDLLAQFPGTKDREMKALFELSGEIKEVKYDIPI